MAGGRNAETLQKIMVPFTLLSAVIGVLIVWFSTGNFAGGVIVGGFGGAAAGAVASFFGGVVWLIVSGIEEGVREVREANEAKARQEIEEQVRRERQQRRETLGTNNAEALESALAAVRKVKESEAASSGWLGDVDFGEDIASINENFQRAYALRKTADRLSRLDSPTDDDRRLLTEATTAIAGLESAANKRVELIKQCAASARSIDESLRKERAAAKTEAQRAELQAELSAMLYGAEAIPARTPTDSAVDSVMARVGAYMEIKNQIQKDRQK